MKYVAISPPEWLLKSLIYQINPRTFSPEGTIAAVTKELPFLHDLGFDIIYLCPIFEEDDSTDQRFWSPRQKKSGTNNPKNPYRMNNYFRIDPEYGTIDDLRQLTSEAHRLGMRVLLDLVYLHIGPNADILKRHPEFAKQNPDGSFICTEWNFPRLDFNCEGLREYLWCNMVYYIGEIDSDGFRCDVGDKIPIDFWVEARRRIQAIKPDAVLICEGSDYSYLLRGFDTSYCFAWHEGLYKVLSGKMTVAELIKEEKLRSKNVPVGGLLIRDMENHDQVTDWPERIEILAGHDGMELIQVLNYAIAGIPMVYCGNELADSSHLNMFSNRFFPGEYEATNRELLKNTESAKRRCQIMKTLNNWRSASEVLRRGGMEFLDVFKSEDIIAFKRVLKEKSVIFIGNFGENAEIVPGDLLAGHDLKMSNLAELAGNTLKLQKYGYAAFEKR